MTLCEKVRLLCGCKLRTPESSESDPVVIAMAPDLNVETLLQKSCQPIIEMSSVRSLLLFFKLWLVAFPGNMPLRTRQYQYSEGFSLLLDTSQTFPFASVSSL